jgi:hypothetical protein
MKIKISYVVFFKRHVIYWAYGHIRNNPLMKNLNY